MSMVTPSVVRQADAPLKVGLAQRQDDRRAAGDGVGRGDRRVGVEINRRQRERACAITHENVL